ncbi:MAG: glycosyltransferase family 8 protein [Kiritimatiellia bacterium]
MDSFIPVAFASDDNGYLSLTVAIYSLVQTACPAARYRILLLSNGLTEEHLARVREEIERRGCTLEVVEMRERLAHADFADVIKRSYADLPVTAFARLFLPELFPSIEKLVYLDTDVLVCENLLPLFNVSLGENAVAAVYEETRDGHVCHLARMPEAMFGYFNSGVLVMNLSFFREHYSVQFWLEQIATYVELPDLDQGLLNRALFRHVVSLHPRWNWHDGMSRLAVSHLFVFRWRGWTERQAIEAAVRPAILHFYGTKKPWFENWRYEGHRYERAMKACGFNITRRYYDGTRQTYQYRYLRGKQLIHGIADGTVRTLLFLAWLVVGRKGNVC